MPSSATVIYHGAYKPLDGQRVTEAFASTVNISFAVRGGLLMRQMHHWAADIFIGSMIVHMARIFFTGAFRKPRELNWTIGVTLLILAILNGFLGYSLPDDLVSGTGIRIAYSILLVDSASPVPISPSGSSAATSPAPAVIPEILHHPLSDHPARHHRTRGRAPLLAGATEAHPVSGQGPDREERRRLADVSRSSWRRPPASSSSWAASPRCSAAFAQINPIWQFGPYTASRISYAVQPDWYMGWLDGALRVFPSWEFTGFGHTIPFEVLIPAVIFPGIAFNLAYAWPLIERKFTGDNALHNLLDRPRNRPKRTAAGVTTLAFMAMLFIASSTDVMANFFHVSLNTVLIAMRVLIIAVPIIAYPLTYKICKELQGVHGAGKRKTHNIVTRTAEGEYVAVPSPAYSEDSDHELDPTPVPTYIEPEPDEVPESGVRTVDR